MEANRNPGGVACDGPFSAVTFNTFAHSLPGHAYENASPHLVSGHNHARTAKFNFDCGSAALG
jgi:hypothetical protein